MKQTLLDYGISITNSPIMCDKISAINLSKNLIHHSRTKQINIRHYFLHDHALKGDISLNFYQLIIKLQIVLQNLLKKIFFLRFRRDSGICNISNI